MSAPVWTVARGHSQVVLIAHTIGLTDRSWLPTELEALITTCGEVWTEVGPGPAAHDSLIAELGLDPHRPLSTVVGPLRRERLEAAAASVGVDPLELDGLRPWLAGQTLEAMWSAAAGTVGEHGPDQVVAQVARSAGINVRNEMSLDAAVRLFASLDDDDQLGYLDHVLEQVSSGPEGAAAQAEPWRSGDLSVPEADERRLATMAPGLHQRLVVARNRNWVVEIDEMLDGRATTAVCLGIAHLVGPESVQRQLTVHGLEAVRT